MKYYIRTKDGWQESRRGWLCLQRVGALQPAEKAEVDRAILTRQRRRQLSYSMAEMLGTVGAYHASIYSSGRAVLGTVDGYATDME
jgi:hypothetical protein